MSVKKNFEGEMELMVLKGKLPTGDNKDSFLTWGFCSIQVCSHKKSETPK